MKNKVFFSILILCILLLPGCGCNHQWEEASCEAPRICTQCGETEGEALGHRWQEATCEAPRTCENCQLTEGNALGHHFDNWWAVNSNAMRHTCQICGKEEDQPIDRQQIVLDKLKNTVWLAEVAYIKADETYRRATEDPHNITFDDQYGFTMDTGAEDGTIYSGTWELESFEDENGMWRYCYRLVLTDEVNRMRCTVDLYRLLSGSAVDTLLLDQPVATFYFVKEITEPLPEETEPVQTEPVPAVEGFVSQEPPAMETGEQYEAELSGILTSVWETTTMVVSSEMTEGPLTKLVFSENHNVVVITPDGSYKGSWKFTGYELLENANGPGSSQDVYFFSLMLEKLGSIQCTANCFEDYSVLSVMNLYGGGEILSFER